MDSTLQKLVKIKIIGVGGGGTNAVERMLGDRIPTVEYITVNTDNAGYSGSSADVKLQIGLRETKGLGAGADPQKGFRSAEENIKEIEEAVKDCDMLFITAGMGGGTGTGAASVVAEIAKRLGILTVAVVTMPFTFEGKKRMDNALFGIERLKKKVDSLVVIPNDNLKKVAKTRITLLNAFEIADSVLMQTVKNLVEVIQNTAYINCDFADVCSIVRNSGYMHTATWESFGEKRSEEILSEITTSTLLDSSIDGADGILLCITAAGDAGLEEIDGIISVISDMASADANIIFGMNFDESMADGMKAVLIATKKTE